MANHIAKPIVPKNATLEQAALHLAAQMARGMRPGGKNGPDYQIYQDFFESIKARTAEEQKRAMNNVKDINSIKVENRRDRKDKSASWYDRLNTLYSCRSGLFIRFKTLAEALNGGDAPRAKKILNNLVKELGSFSQEYADYMASAGKTLINQHPELYRFTELWENGAFLEGKEVEKVLNSALEAASAEGDSPAPQKERKPIEAKLPEEKQPEDEQDQIFNINEFLIQKEREKTEESERFAAHVTRNVYKPGKNSYESVLGECALKAQKAERDELEKLMAEALTAAQFRRENKNFDRTEIKNAAEDLQYSDGFAAMVQNTAYMKEALSKPEKFNETLDTFRREQKLEQQGKPARKSYDEYLRRHTWPNVPEGRETEYLAKAIAAHRLASNGTPFDLSEIRSDAKLIEKQTSFQELTTEPLHDIAAEKNVVRWLHRDNLRPASHELADLRRKKIEANGQEPKNKRVKSWAGYRRMHTGENVPANASPAEKRLYLAKAAVAIRGMADDQKFSVKTARKQAEKLMKNKYFLAATKDPAKVSRMLEEGNVTKIFGDMADARRELLGLEKPTADVSILSKQGRENSLKQPVEQGSVSI